MVSALNINTTHGTPTGRPRRVLMIACAFPPTGGSGVQRSAKFAKYLPQFGWLPTVWTAGSIDTLPQDETLLHDLPADVTIITQPRSSAVHSMRRSLRLATESRFRPASRFAAAIDWRLEAWLAKTSLPDDFASWAKGSIEPLSELIEAGGFEVIYSTFSPPSNHWIALELKRRFGLPWVADFRDLWTDDYRYHEPSIRRRQSHRRLQQEILEHADAVIGVTQRQTQIFASHLPEEASKFHTITNGYDESDFEGIKIPTHENQPFVLAHVGRFDRWRTNDGLFDALGTFAKQTTQKNVQLRIVGHVSDAVRHRVQETSIPVTFSGHVTHREAIQEMIGASALLLCVPDGPNADSVIPAKLFEYLAAGRPIVVVGPKGGACEKIVQACDAGICTGFDAASIAQALVQTHDKWKSATNTTRNDTAKIAAFSRRKLTKKLADIFDRYATPTRAENQRNADALAEVCAP